MTEALNPDRDDASLPWFALYVRARHEKVVEQSLTGKGYRAFSPFHRIRRRRTDRTVDLDQALFPSYVFCQFDVEKRLPVLQTPGVVFAVSGSKGPEPVDHSEIKAIQTMLASGQTIQPWAFLNAGQRIRVTAGALAGMEGILVRVKDRDCIVASVTLLQRSLIVELEQSEVEPIY